MLQIIHRKYIQFHVLLCNMMIWYFVSVLFILLHINQTSSEMYEIHSTKAIYESLTDKLVVNASVSKTKGLTIYINVAKDFNELFTDVTLVVDMNDQNIYDFEVIKRLINTCKLFRDPTYEPVVQFLYKLFLKSGNFPTSCPVKEGIYYIKDMKTDPKNLPQMMSGKKAMFTVKHLSKENNEMTLLAYYQVYFTVERVRSANANASSTSGTSVLNKPRKFPRKRT